MTWALWPHLEQLAPKNSDWLWPEMSRCNIAAANTARSGFDRGL